MICWDLALYISSRNNNWIMNSSFMNRMSYRIMLGQQNWLNNKICSNILPRHIILLR